MVTSVTLFFLAILAFAASSRGLLMALTENVVLISHAEGYSRWAAKIAKSYKVGAWFFLTFFLFITTAKFFLDVFLAL
jgi:hypothetical protein